ncbi:hypothetical protein AB205_0222190, partial [Aquarana catesbeiana]
MITENTTAFTEFLLAGLSDISELQVLLFVLFFGIYVLTLLANVTIILITWLSPNLHTPMYFFLGNFSFLEICYVSSTVPKMLSTLLAEHKTITYILSAILNIRLSSGKKKTFSTCASHFVVVMIFYGSGIFMYFRPKSSYSMDQDRLIAVMYTIIAPLLNPFIYTFRNSDVKAALSRLVDQIIITQK